MVEYWASPLAEMSAACWAGLMVPYLAVRRAALMDASKVGRTAGRMAL